MTGMNQLNLNIQYGFNNMPKNNNKVINRNSNEYKIDKNNYKYHHNSENFIQEKLNNLNIKNLNKNNIIQYQYPSDKLESLQANNYGNEVSNIKKKELEKKDITEFLKNKK